MASGFAVIPVWTSDGWIIVEEGAVSQPLLVDLHPEVEVVVLAREQDHADVHRLAALEARHEPQDRVAERGLRHARVPPRTVAAG